MIRRLQDDRVRGRRLCGGRDLLQADPLLGQQAADDLTERVVADTSADTSWHASCSEGKTSVRYTSSESELCRANLVELAWHQLWDAAEFRSDVDAKMPGDKY
jgi:hypothetical protein